MLKALNQKEKIHLLMEWNLKVKSLRQLGVEELYIANKKFGRIINDYR
jgi:hypothetical protein